MSAREHIIVSPTRRYHCRFGSARGIARKNMKYSTTTTQRNARVWLLRAFTSTQTVNPFYSFSSEQTLGISTGSWSWWLTLERASSTKKGFCRASTMAAKREDEELNWNFTTLSNLINYHTYTLTVESGREGWQNYFVRIHMKKTQSQKRTTAQMAAARRRSSIKEILHELTGKFPPSYESFAEAFHHPSAVHVMCECLCVLCAMTGDANRFSGSEHIAGSLAHRTEWYENDKRKTCSPWTWKFWSASVRDTHRTQQPSMRRRDEKYFSKSNVRAIIIARHT